MTYQRRRVTIMVVGHTQIPGPDPIPFHGQANQITGRKIAAQNRPSGGRRERQTPARPLPSAAFQARRTGDVAHRGATAVSRCRLRSKRSGGSSRPAPVRNSRSSQTTGEFKPGLGTTVFQRMFLPSSTFHVKGGSASMACPLAPGPRKPGQLVLCFAPGMGLLGALGQGIAPEPS
jgi:hypothetical protein